MSRRRALSELTGAILIAVATIGIGSIAAQQIISYTLKAQSFLTSHYRRAADAEGQQLSLSYNWTNGTYTHILLFNYGWRDVSVRTVFLDGLKLSEWTIDKQAIKPKELAQLSVRGTGQNLTIITDLDKVLRFRIT